MQRSPERGKGAATAAAPDPDQSSSAAAADEGRPPGSALNPTQVGLGFTLSATDTGFTSPTPLAMRLDTRASLSQDESAQILWIDCFIRVYVCLCVCVCR